MNHHRRTWTGRTALFAVLLSSSVLAAQTPAAPPPAAPPAAKAPADNTKVNTRDRAKGAVTADQQKENDTDRGITQKIRQELVADKNLSTYAHNVKVVTQGGHVTLKGPVRSDDEKKAIEAKAVEVAGAGHVTNQISVAPASTKPVKK